MTRSGMRLGADPAALRQRRASAPALLRARAGALSRVSKMLDAIDNRYLPRELLEVPRELLSWARYLALHEGIRLPLIGAHRFTSLLARFVARRQMPARDTELEHAVRE